MAVMDKSKITDLPVISWGAVFAGLFFVIAASWLLFLLGSAIGVSIADASDMDAIGKGLGWGAVIWIILTEIVVFFVGGVLTARLAGRLNDLDGLLHGLTLWGVGTVVMLLLGSWGVGNALQAGQSLISGVASMGKAVVRGVSAAGSTVAGAADSQLMTDVTSMIKRQAAQTAARGGGNVSAPEVERAIDQLDAQTLQSIAQQIAKGDTQGAKNALARATSLSRQEVDQIVNNVSRQMAQSPAVEQVRQFLNRQVNQALSQVSQTSPDVSRSELRRAVENLDAGTLGEIARNLVMGDTEGAKRVLSANTNLSEQDIDSVINGISQQVNQRVQQAKQRVGQTVEQASDYAQAVVWTLFVSALLALIAALIGGSLGARAV